MQTEMQTAQQLATRIRSGSNSLHNQPCENEHANTSVHVLSALGCEPSPKTSEENIPIVSTFPACCSKSPAGLVQYQGNRVM